MTTLVEEMAKAIKEGRPAYRGDDFDYDLAAQAALDCVLKRLREPSDEQVYWMARYCNMIDSEESHKDMRFILRSLATHLDQERSRK
jgi:hypothetical protein